MWHFFLVFLSFIWVLICIWFAMICNVVWKVLTGEGAEDTRSDDEDEGESEESEDGGACVPPFIVFASPSRVTSADLPSDPCAPPPSTAAASPKSAPGRRRPGRPRTARASGTRATGGTSRPPFQMRRAWLSLIRLSGGLRYRLSYVYERPGTRAV